MRLNFAFLFYGLFNLADAAIDKIPCHYSVKSESFIYTISIAGIQQNVTCKENCGCSGTDIGYTTVLCQSCCCQDRVRKEKSQKRGTFMEINYGRPI